MPSPDHPRRCHRRPSSTLLAGALLATFASGASLGASQVDPGPRAGERPSELETVVVTGTRSEHTVEDTPVPTQVLDAKAIEAVATDNVELLLSSIPDLYVRRNEEFGLGASTVRMQGLDADKTAILIDGRRFRGGVEGVVDLRDIAVGGIEQIEIVRGPASSLYGSDAMSGVINIRTRSGGEDPSLRTEAAFGTAGRERLSAQHGWSAGPLAWYLMAQHDAVAIADLYGVMSGQYAGDASDDLQERDALRLRLDGDAGDHALRFVGDWLVERNPLSTSDDLSSSAGWTWDTPREWKVESDLGAYRYSRRNDLEGFAEDVEYLDLNSDTRASRHLGSFLRGEHFLAAGSRLRRERLQSAGMVLPGGDLESPDVDEAVLHASPYAQVESLFGHAWSLVLGVAVDHHERYGWNTSPRGTLTWRPREDLRASVTVGRGYRAPDLLQLYDVDINNVVVVGNRVSGYAIVGNPDLDPETDLGQTFFVEYTGLPWARLTFDAFHHDLTDGIGFVLACNGGACTPGFENPLPDLDGPVFTYRNIASATTAGVNVAAEIDPLRALGVEAPAWRARLTLGAGWLHARNGGQLVSESGKRLPFRPDARVIPGAEASHLPTGTTLRLFGEWNGRQYSDLANTDAGEVDPYFSLGARFTQGLGALASRLGWEMPAAAGDLELYVHAENLADESVAGGFGPAGPMALLPRRNVQAGLVWKPGVATDAGNGGTL